MKSGESPAHLRGEKKTLRECTVELAASQRARKQAGARLNALKDPPRRKPEHDAQLLAQVSQVNVTVQKLPNAISMEVADDGKGFEIHRLLFATRAHRSGVLGMRERVRMVGGQFNFESAAGRGTTVRAQIPVGKGCGPRENTHQ